MLATLVTAVVSGLHGALVRVEVDVSPGLPVCHIVGLPDAALSEARERVRAAIRNAGFAYPASRITVNLAPADRRKHGAAYDLATGAGPGGRPGPGAGPRGRRAMSAALRPVIRVSGLPAAGIAAPTGAAPEGRVALVSGLEPVDLREVRGQPFARWALEGALAGGPNLLMVGPPGAGKTLLARAIPGLLPPLDEDEALEVAVIASVAGLLGDGRRPGRRRPFRAPHHTAS